jgi:hypothetical protein
MNHARNLNSKRQQAKDELTESAHTEVTEDTEEFRFENGKTGKREN